jgi:phage repressor protein C with HTH and peptisase S24 domain
MSEFEAKFERIKAATGLNTQVDLAEFFGIRQSSISDAKKRDSVPSGWYLSLVRKLSINPEWVDTGLGAKFLTPSASTEDGTQSLYDIQASYGAKESTRSVQVYSMSGEPASDGLWRKELLKHIGIPYEFDMPSLLVVHMEGTSMEPFIRAGAYVGLDREKRGVLSGEIYAVQVPFGGLVLRRIFMDTQNDKLVLKSDNRDHADQEMPLKNYQANLVGRLVWVMQKV